MALDKAIETGRLRSRLIHITANDFSLGAYSGTDTPDSSPRRGKTVYIAYVVTFSDYKLEYLLTTLSVLEKTNGEMESRVRFEHPSDQNLSG